MNALSRLLGFGLFALALSAAHAAADMSAASTDSDKLAPVRAQIAARNWSGAIDELKRINDTGSAEWNNLMGYSLRKAKTPDLAGSEKFYNEALRIDPKHLGTLEYSGELYLMKGELPKAEQRLAALDAACHKTCSEYADLKRAIERYKAAGQKYVASDY
ncbi:tetratricopeptide repeat protein [Piscinibacter gummiphilus]|uniref:Tetratricopeptide repeat protein n=1 Tax=Piscinibacter gummiphilus TaxID=946333 RepID=A0ABZ0CTH2_9BURK|nr:tetratricopeptide repeat protein [Piscinibacter gummiphilus]WOB08275.1 tetratricopeptide repeat protein [Piscinibacter gummiphilus]